MSAVDNPDDVDSQLRFSAFLPDFNTWLERMAADSATVTMPQERHSYGPATRQWVEIAMGSGSRPVVPVLIHGGYWRALTAEDHRFALPALARLGPNVANLEYRLMPGARMADLVADVVTGLRTVLDLIGCPNKLLLIGHSAGAQLALAALGQDREFAAHVTGVVSISGTFDLGLIARSFLQDELQLQPSEIALFSITEAPAVPTLFLAGSQETAPFRMQANLLAATQPTAHAVTITPCHHMNILHATLSSEAPLLPRLVDWLDGGKIVQDIKVSLL